MANRTAGFERIRSVKTLPQLIAYLRDELAWPITVDDIEDIVFDYNPLELGFDSRTAVSIKEIKQIRPLTKNQRWGVFWINFEKKKLPVVMLRRILAHLAIKKRTSSMRPDSAAWQMNDLLFISAYGEEHERAITMGHFSGEVTNPNSLAVLRVLSWDEDDTFLHVKDVYDTLKEKLRWPENPQDLNHWNEQWTSAFVQRHKEVIATTRELVTELAKLACSIKKRSNSILARETEQGPLRKLLKAFQSILIHDLPEDDFSDVMAQTISYGLLAAKFSRLGSITRSHLVEMIPQTNPFLREVLGMFLNITGHKKKFDFDELGIQEVVDLLNNSNTEAVKKDFGNRTQQEDPVIHFYEHFLSAYDKQKKIKRGVFYTPQPVVSFIVRSVHETLKNEFGLADGLAATITWSEYLQGKRENKLPEGTTPNEFFVTILDPATGTATFLVEVIEVIFNHLQDKWHSKQKSEMPLFGGVKTIAFFKGFNDYWNSYVTLALLPRLYGFELMMAPYTIAHMKIGLKLTELNERLGQPDFVHEFAERAHIYLTNSLEPASELAAEKTANLFEALGHESTAVNYVKRNKQFTVVIGNPPYSGISGNIGPWITELIEDYKYVSGVHFGERKHWLQDDYVKFLRFGEHLVKRNGRGVLAFINNHSFIDNPTFRGMRWNLLSSFEDIYIIDLHGNSKKKEISPDKQMDQNVFDIQAGVSINIFIKKDESEKRELAKVKHKDLWGNREHKYQVLLESVLTRIIFNKVHYSSPFYFFQPKNELLKTIYNNGFYLGSLFIKQSMGITTARDHFVIDLHREKLLERILEFCDKNKTDDFIRNKYFGFKSSGKYLPGDTRGWQMSKARKVIDQFKHSENIRTIAYRPFDKRFIYYSKSMVDWGREEIMNNLFSNNVALCCVKVGRDVASFNAYVTNDITDKSITSSLDNSNVFPLYIHSGALNQYDAFSNSSAIPNLNKDIIDAISVNLSLTYTSNIGDRHKTFAPIDVFDYTYAVLYSPKYREHYKEFLKIDFPHIPYPQCIDTFWTLVKLGCELRQIHLLESPYFNRFITHYPIKGINKIENVKYMDGFVWINEKQFFSNVPQVAWDFYIGGYQPAQKWLKDRKGRQLSEGDIEHYHKIIVALTETNRLMKEIDNVIVL